MQGQRRLVFGVGMRKAVFDDRSISIVILVKYSHYVNHINRHLTFKNLIEQSVLTAAIHSSIGDLARPHAGRDGP